VSDEQIRKNRLEAAETELTSESRNLVAFIFLLLLELTPDQVDRVCEASRGDFSQFTIPPGVRERIACNSVSSLDSAWGRRLDIELEKAAQGSSS
jgi:hypothetical protein